MFRIFKLVVLVLDIGSHFLHITRLMISGLAAMNVVFELFFDVLLDSFVGGVIRNFILDLIFFYLPSYN